LNQPLFTKEDDEEPASHDIEFNDILSNDILLYLRGSNSNIKLERDDTINEKDFLNFE